MHGISKKSSEKNWDNFKLIEQFLLPDFNNLLSAPRTCVRETENLKFVDCRGDGGHLGFSKKKFFNILYL